jgi:hypothetical protein
MKSNTEKRGSCVAVAQYVGSKSCIPCGHNFRSRSGQQDARHILACLGINDREGNTLGSPSAKLLDGYVVLVRGIIETASSIPLDDHWLTFRNC